MALIHAQEISFAAAEGGVVVTFTSGAETLEVFMQRSAFYVAIQDSKNLVSELEAEEANVVELRG